MIDGETDTVPLFPVKKQILKWIRENKKTVEINDGKPRKGNETVFRSGRSVARRKIIETREGRLEFFYYIYGFKKVVPVARTLEETPRFFETLSYDINGIFTAHALANE